MEDRASCADGERTHQFNTGWLPAFPGAALNFCARVLQTGQQRSSAIKWRLAMSGSRLVSGDLLSADTYSHRCK